MSVHARDPSDDQTNGKQRRMNAGTRALHTLGSWSLWSRDWTRSRSFLPLPPFGALHNFKGSDYFSCHRILFAFEIHYRPMALGVIWCNSDDCATHRIDFIAIAAINISLDRSIRRAAAANCSSLPSIIRTHSYHISPYRPVYDRKCASPGELINL